MDAPTRTQCWRLYAMKRSASKADKWYSKGLRFECIQCGNCCTGPPGYVWVTREEIALIAQFLGFKDEWLGPEYIRRVGLRYSLTERPNGDCVFLGKLQNGKRTCQIYPVRPLQCRTWPFWESNLLSPEAWRQAARICPGMNHGRLYSFEEIERIRTTKRWR